jgi:hypothetical protein
MARSLTSSVGKGCTNLPDDVITVKELLNSASEIFGAPSNFIDPVDGIVDGALVDAISRFQRSNLFGFFDGRIDPGGSTLKRLNGVVDETVFLFLGVEIDNSRVDSASAITDISQDFKDTLTLANNDLFLTFSALPDDEKSDSNGVLTYGEWCGVREKHIGLKDKLSRHSVGKALDIDASRNPYIATRTGAGPDAVFGGELATASVKSPRSATLSQAQRKLAVDVYDRAMQFMFDDSFRADVEKRRTGEQTGPDSQGAPGVYGRFNVVSDALRLYLGFGFLAKGPATINRAPDALFFNGVLRSVSDPSVRAILDSIPTTERQSKGQAVAALADHLDPSKGSFLLDHPSFPADPVELYYQILRDYELVRIPMVFGDPSLDPPTSTRNPALGFLHLRAEIVIELCDGQKLNWGACDFGPTASGDVMHFDMGPPR